MRGAHLDGGYEHGWLTFERLDPGEETDGASSSYVRRLTPIPREWETVPEQRLELMCRAAEEVRRRISDPLGRTSLDASPRPDLSEGR